LVALGDVEPHADKPLPKISEPLSDSVPSVCSVVNALSDPATERPEQDSHEDTKEWGL